MNKVKQLGCGFVLLMCIGGAEAKSPHSNQLVAGPSFESSMLPGSKLVAGGEDEFFIVAAAEFVPSKPKVVEQPIERVAVKEVMKPEVVYAVKQLASKTPKPIAFEVKPATASSDPAEKKINRLFALHQAIGAASDKPQRVMAAVKIVKPIKQIHVAAIKPARPLHNMKLKA